MIRRVEAVRENAGRSLPVRLLCALLLPLAAAVAAGAERGEVVAWEHASPGDAGFDAQALSALVRDMRHDWIAPGLHSFLIVRGGKLVVEEYFDGWDATRPHTQQSVSKSFTSALVGIAIERGDFSGVEERVIDFFAERADFEHLDDRKRAMRLTDLLTMRSGTDYHERGADSPHSRLNRLARGWDRFYMNRPMTSDPGTRFRYDSGAVIVTSSLLERRTGLHADAYAARHLFAPLGIEQHRWSRNAENHPHTGGGLYVTPRAMAKFGLLYLRGGRWGDVQVVPEAWVEASTATHVVFGDEHSRPHEIGYGYWWWILEPDPAGDGLATIYAALGFRGQHIFVVPEHDIVVVTTAGISGRRMHEPISLLYSHILPALHRPGS